MSEYTTQGPIRSVYVCFEGAVAEIGIAPASRPSRAKSALASAAGADDTPEWIAHAPETDALKGEVPLFAQ